MLLQAFSIYVLDFQLIPRTFSCERKPEQIAHELEQELCSFGKIMLLYKSRGTVYPIKVQLAYIYKT